VSPLSVLEEGSRSRGSRRGRSRPPRPPRPSHRGRWIWGLVVVLVLAAAVVVPTVLDHATDEGGSSGGKAALREVGGGDDVALKGQPSVATSPPVNPQIAAYAKRPDTGHVVRVHFKAPPSAGLLFDLDTGKVLWSHNSHKVLSIASLTKMMTSILVARSEPADAKVRITRQALAYQGSGVGILPKHKEVQLETLLYGLMLPSGNDAAIALAQKVTHGSVRAFVRRMNREARRLGLRCTRYSGPDGFDDRGNKSCARDLAVLARQIMRNKRLKRIVGTRKAVRPFPVKGHRIYLYNNNTLMVRKRYPGVTGVKTGYTNKAGHCLVATATRGGHTLGIVLLHSPDTADQGSRLFDRGFRALHA
jgi:serine-type D-Ala-D-Ala carboxypeptidase (penicillin-binding protein 5/6)